MPFKVTELTLNRLGSYHYPASSVFVVVVVGLQMSSADTNKSQTGFAGLCSYFNDI